MLPVTAKPGPLREIMDRTGIAAGDDDPASTYAFAGGEGKGSDGSFAAIMTFKHATDDKRTLVLTEKSSQRVSHKHKLICGRDEDTDTFRKVYRFQRDGASLCATSGCNASYTSSRPAAAAKAASALSFSSSSIIPSITLSPPCQNAGSRASRPNGLSNSE